MKKLPILTLAMCALGVIFTTSASAHVLITEPGTSVGAILHIQPDDDPVAGEPSSLFFDVQGTLVQGQKNKVTITDEAGSIVEPPITTQQNSITTEHTFPSQGVYIIQLTIGEHTLTQSQRVSRGAIVNTIDTDRHQIAEIGLLVSATAVIVLGIVAINRRNTILENSK